MHEPASYVEQSDRLTSIFGYWPSFHDAEVIEVHFWRGDVDVERDSYVFPVLTVKLHLWELTDETDGRGSLVRRHHTLATLRFHDVQRDIELAGFDHENAIQGLTIIWRERDTGPSPVLDVKFEPAFGMRATFTCRRAEVLAALRCDEHGKPSGA